MRHHNANRKFGRTAPKRRALLSSLASNMIIRGKIKTTEAKAKELRPFVEKLVTRAKLDTVPGRRLLISRLAGRADVVKKLIEGVAPSYRERSGGYARIIKLPSRKSDGSPMALIEFV